MYPLVGFWLDLGVVMIQLSGPGPMGEWVGERKLGKFRHCGEIVFSVDLRKESQWAADMKLCGDERDPPVVLLNRLKLKQKPPKR
jgi:hypothetical protein